MNWDLDKLLRGPGAEDLIRQALATSGMPLESWQLQRVYTRPLADFSTEISASFQVVTAGYSITLVASTRELTEQQRDQLGAVRAEAATGEGIIHLWAHPTDPELVGLQIAEDPARLGQLLERAPDLKPALGLGAATPLIVESTEMLVLRPLRRAVHRIVISAGRDYGVLYVKTVPPHKAHQIRARSAACSLSPRVWDVGHGLLAIAEAPGYPLNQLLYRARLTQGSSSVNPPPSPSEPVVPTPETVFSALESLRPEAYELPRRTAPAPRYRQFTEALLASGADAGQLQELTSAIEDTLLAEPGPIVATHGDFHPANIFLSPDGSVPTALIDTDTVGPGFAADDMAVLLAHLIALPSFDAAGYAAVPDFFDEVWGVATRKTPEGDLTARTAASLLSLAPGAGSAAQLEYYLEAAYRLLDSPSGGWPGPRK